MIHLLLSQVTGAPSENGKGGVPLPSHAASTGEPAFDEIWEIHATPDVPDADAFAGASEDEDTLHVRPAADPRAPDEEAGPIAENGGMTGGTSDQPIADVGPVEALNSAPDAETSEGRENAVLEAQMPLFPEQSVDIARPVPHPMQEADGPLANAASKAEGIFETPPATPKNTHPEGIVGWQPLAALPAVSQNAPHATIGVKTPMPPDPESRHGSPMLKTSAVRADQSPVRDVAPSNRFLAAAPDETWPPAQTSDTGPSGNVPRDVQALVSRDMGVPTRGVAKQERAVKGEISHARAEGLRTGLEAALVDSRPVLSDSDTPNGAGPFPRVREPEVAVAPFRASRMVLREKAGTLASDIGAFSPSGSAAGVAVERNSRMVGGALHRASLPEEDLLARASPMTGAQAALMSREIVPVGARQTHVAERATFRDLTAKAPEPPSVEGESPKNAEPASGPKVIVLAGRTLVEAAPNMAAIGIGKATPDEPASNGAQETLLPTARAPSEAQVQNIERGQTVSVAPVSKAVDFVADAPARPEGDPVGILETPLQPRNEAGTIKLAAASISHDPAAGRLVAQQLAETIQTRGNGVVELALRPEDLGRVRMVLAGSESQMTVVIQAERPGTEELIRRHLEQLQQDLQDIGYSSISFAFGDRTPEGEAQVRSAGLGPEIEGDMADEELIASAPARHVAGGGMDIRM